MSAAVKQAVPGSSFQQTKEGCDSFDPYYSHSLGKYPVIMGLEREGGAKFMYGLRLAVDSSAD